MASLANDDTPPAKRLKQSTIEALEEETPLDNAYDDNYYNDTPLRQEIIALLRSKGGKANNHDANGSWVGYYNGDLND
eukprot:g15174.t1